ncbi:MAG: hypothetical protein K2X77_21220 [Candidatus Obscuribacterales bacterium]|jgi:hypothetical protein|nr:hypothetical protein [Candidatus Obscuribacterales bacterium]
MNKALIELVDALSEIEKENDEIGDTDVREQMFEAVHKSFIAPEKGYVLPDEFGMFSPEGNKSIKEALSRFLNHPEVKAAAEQLKTPQERLNAFQDLVDTESGITQEDYFGYCETP